MLGRRQTSYPLSFLLVAIISSTTGCKSKEDTPKRPSVETETPANVKETPPVAMDAAALASAPNWYRVTLHSKEHKTDVPFYLGIPAHGASNRAVLLQGIESTELPITWSDTTHFEVKFELLQSALRGTIDSANTLSGDWQQKSGSWGEATLIMRGEAVDSPRSEKLFDLPAADKSTPIETKGSFKLSRNDSGNVKLELDSDKDGAAHAMLYFGSGNIIALAGQAADGKLRLAGFDGTSVYRLEAEFDGELLAKGSWMVGASLGWQESFGGQRADDFDLDTGPKMPNPKKGIQVAGVDLSAYRGKPTIIEMAGSWCITCRFAAPFLREIYSEYHPKGLEMVTLSYEFTDDRAYNAKRTNEFKAEYKIDWDVIAVSGGPEAFDDIMPTGLEDVDVSGFPISIFVDRDGIVQYIHAGFPGSTESEVYATVTKEYREKVESLLAP